MLWHYAATALAAVAIGTAGGWQVRGWIADRQAAEVREQIATEREQAIHAALVETARRLQEQEQVTRHARTQSTRARADAAAARSAADSLRDAATAAAGRACDDPAVAGRGEADRLADVLGEATRELELVAAAADRAIIAGQACESAYEGLTR
jgi:hypothetical protein